ncbi:MAG: DUF4190 domain-containing protein, partial [Bacteroidales bacterium]
MNNTSNSNAGMGLGIAGLVLGILSVPLGLMKCTFATGLVFGILGITLSAIGLSQARKANSPTGMIIAALIVSIIGTCFAFIKLTTSIAKFNVVTDKWRDHIEIIDEQSDEFEEGFDEEFDDDMEETLEELEEDLDVETEESIHIEIDLDETMKGLSDEEKARKLGKATGKAVKEFVRE